MGSDILNSRSKKIKSSWCHTSPCVFDIKDLGCLIFKESRSESVSSVCYLKKNTYGSESFWSVTCGTIVAEASNTSRWLHFYTRGCITIYNTTFRDRSRIHWPRILRRARWPDCGAGSFARSWRGVDQIVKACCARWILYQFNQGRVDLRLWRTDSVSVPCFVMDLKNTDTTSVLYYEYYISSSLWTSLWIEL